MIKRIFLFCFVLMFSSCARIGAPTGGDQDTTPPKVVKEEPLSGTLNFNKNRIRIYFDEYITLKDAKKQLIISPPFKNQPEIIPMGIASRFIDIKIKDTLHKNTTYTINFGNSIQDYNENNPLSFYKYVFSTGDKIDSLVVRGEIKDALLKKTDNFVSVMLYQFNENYKDSIIYKEKPFYATNTLDSLTKFEISNVKEGKYILVALKDKAEDNIFDPKQDKIAFLGEPISVPDSSFHSLSLFKEEKQRRITRPFQSAEKRISLGYEGAKDSIKIEFLEPKPKNFEYFISKDPAKDTLNIFFSPKIEDSLKFIVKNHKIDTLKVNFRKMKPDSLTIQTKNITKSPFLEYLEFNSNIPIKKFNPEKIEILNKDSLKVDFKHFIKEDNLKIALEIKTTEKQNYKVTVFPEAFLDFFNHKNDTIKTSFTTKSKEDFSTFKLKISKEIKFPILVEFTTNEGKKVDFSSHFKQNQEEFAFEYIKPGKYFIRVIEDENGNEKWDTGSFLQKKQPENVYYLPKEIDLRPNWEIQETF